MKRIISMIIALVLALSMLCIATAEEKPIKLGILSSAVTHAWVEAVAYNAEEQAKEMKFDYKVLTSKTAEEMAGQLSELLAWGAEAIVIFPQWGGMEDTVKEAIDKGVKVVSFDLDIPVDGIYKVSGNNLDMGVQGAKYIAEKLQNKGKVVVLEVPSAGSVSELRKKGFVDTLKELAPEIELSFFSTQFTRDSGLKDMADILTKMDHIDGVYSMDDETTIGALQAIEEAKREDIKVITGGGGMQEYFKLMPKYEKIWLQSALYSPIMVRQAVQLAEKLVKGEEVQKETIIPTTIVDRENYEKFLDEKSPY